MQVLEKVRLSSCIDVYDMEWYICLRDVLQKNGINPYVHDDAMRDLLIHGRGKFRNVMISGPANCCKNAFSNPANKKYAWVGADNADGVILQDFVWSTGLICWKDLLLLNL